MRKIYVVGGSYGYAKWMEGKVVNKMKDADLVVFTGGADVNPKLYGKEVHPMTYYSNPRDHFEVEEFQEARSRGKKLIGICRGAQLLCVMAGGILVQHSDHPYNHRMETLDGVIRINSLHHQRQYPWVDGKKINFKLLGWVTNLSPFNYGESRKDDMTGKPEVEMAVYPDIDALAIQSHPEMVFPMLHPWEKKYINFCQSCLTNHMNTDYNAAAVAA